MITRVQIKNFRSIANVDVELNQLNVLVGKNSSGKSNFLDALRFVRDALQLGLDNAITLRYGLDSLWNWTATRKSNLQITITTKSNNFQGEYGLILARNKDIFQVKSEFCKCQQDNQIDSFEVKDGQLSINIQSISPTIPLKNNLVDKNSLTMSFIHLISPLFSHLVNELNGGFYSIFPNTLREPQIPSNNLILEDHAGNLASVLKHIKEQGIWFEDLQAALAMVIDGISKVNVKSIGGYLVTELLHQDVNSSSRSAKEPWFNLAQESDGTLRMLGLLVALYQKDNHNGLIALEEPELALHPGALAVLSDVIREASKRRQIIITTQSPDLISRFEAEELRIVERQNGLTTIGLLDETQRSVIEDQLFSAGDLLRIEGLRSKSV